MRRHNSRPIDALIPERGIHPLWSVCYDACLGSLGAPQRSMLHNDESQAARRVGTPCPDLQARPPPASCTKIADKPCILRPGRVARSGDLPAMRMRASEPETEQHGLGGSPERKHNAT